MTTNWQTHKKCSKCGETKPISHFHRAGRRNGRVQFSSACAECINRGYRMDYKKKRGGNISNPEHHKKYIRARSRALTKLSKLVPELYLQTLYEEAKEEGIENNVDWKKVGSLHYSKSKAMDMRKVRHQ